MIQKVKKTEEEEWSGGNIPPEVLDGRESIHSAYAASPCRLLLLAVRVIKPERPCMLQRMPLRGFGWSIRLCFSRNYLSLLRAAPFDPLAIFRPHHLYRHTLLNCLRHLPLLLLEFMPDTKEKKPVQKIPKKNSRGRAHKEQDGALDTTRSSISSTTLKTHRALYLLICGRKLAEGTGSPTLKTTKP